MRADHTVVHPKALARYSLRWRLPLLLATLIALILSAFLGVAVREVRANLLQTAGTRAQAIADQLAGLLTQSTQQRLTEFRRVARQPAVRRVLRNPTDEARESAKSSLATLTNNGPQVIEVWDNAGQCVVSLPLPPTAATVLPPRSAPSALGIAPLRRHQDVVVSESVVEILPDPSPDGSPRVSQERLGLLVVRRTITAAPTADVLNRLVGQGAAIAVGNKAGDVWTDLSKVIDPPAVNLARSGLSEYQGRDGQRYLGSLADIGGTPWAVWVEFSHRLIFAPARAFLQRMLLMALGFVALSSVVVGIVTARITTPLHELTSASEAIASGEYARRVAMGRRDEIGRLSGAFNTMTEQVENAHRGLEERVRQRTASLEEATTLLEQRVREIKDAREELDRFFSLSLDLLCIANRDGHFTRVNAAWEAVLGWTPEELTSGPYVDLVHPDDRAATGAEASQLATGNSTLNFENRYRHKDGSYRWLSWTAAWHPERGLIYAAARDVTEQKRVARALQQHADDLATVNRELEAFSYSVSHDLRAPLRHITGFAMMLEQSTSSSLDSEGRRHLKTITEAATRMGRLIDDLLAFSRVGRTQLVRSRINLNQLARDARHEVSVDLNGRVVSWQFHDLPVVEGDPSLLHLVLVNLLSNALKYSAIRPRAEIEVGALAGDGTETVVYVRDNGVGFDMQYADKLFGVFQRLHSGDEFEGTGIGLANVRRIVQRHGGRTWAEGRVEGGATFYFSLPHERMRGDA
jgi:PAS domain S-box-containing protein